MNTLRVWQDECRAQLLSVFGARRDFLVAATPGAGKTDLSLSFARALIDDGAIDGVHVVAPTRLISINWREKAAAFGIELGSDTDTRHGGAGGLATTYAQVAREPQAHAAIVGRRRTLVIPDECHHSSDDRAWGVAMKEAFDAARFRLNLSGTPFRMDAHPIPFIEYTADGISKADYLYGYTRAIAECVCRPVTFNPYDAYIRLRGPASDDDMARVLRLSLMPKAGIVEKMVRDADADLIDKRKHFPDAAGLLVAMTQAHARVCADIIQSVTGQRPPVVISDSETADSDLAAFRHGTARWVVSVKMLSEGVDVPRLMVAIYATNIVTTLFFRQFIGRIVRVRDHGAQESAVVYMPRDDRLIREATNIEAEVRQFLKDTPNGYPDIRQQLAAGTTLVTNAPTPRRVDPIDADGYRVTPDGIRYKETMRPSYR